MLGGAHGPGVVRCMVPFGASDCLLQWGQDSQDLGQRSRTRDPLGVQGTSQGGTLLSGGAAQVGCVAFCGGKNQTVRSTCIHPVASGETGETLGRLLVQLACLGQGRISCFVFRNASLSQAVLEESHHRTIRSCEWSPDGKFLATASFDATTAIWEQEGGEFECVASLEVSSCVNGGSLALELPSHSS